VGFEPTIPTLERAKTIHALDRAATMISGILTDGEFRHIYTGLLFRKVAYMRYEVAWFVEETEFSHLDS
jgi:hypothetical protein